MFHQVPSPTSLSIIIIYIVIVINSDSGEAVESGEQGAGALEPEEEEAGPVSAVCFV
jgi:hypothetical protein